MFSFRPESYITLSYQAFSTAGRILYLLHEQMPCSIFPKFKHVQILVYAESLSTRNTVQKVTR